jgi:Fe-S oxidoreductase/nitrate reductase gamma subunit
MPADPIRQSYLFLPWYASALVYSTFFICGLIMLYGLHRHLRGYGLGVGQFVPLVTKDIGRTVSRFLKYGLGQRRVVRSDSGGLMHGALFYGFLMLLAYTTLIFIQSDILPLFTSFVFLQGEFYLALEFLGDTLGIAFIVGLAIAVFRRYVQKLEKLETRWDDYLVLTMLIWIGISGFLIEALRFLAIPSQWAAFSPVGDILASGISALNLPGGPDQRSIYQLFWWAHMFSVFALIAVTPYTKLVHVFTSAANVALAPEKPMGRLNTPFSLSKMMESESFEMPPNVKKVTDFAPVQLLALDACTNCGRCQEVCPAYAAGRDLSPRLVVRDLGGELFRNPSEDVLAAGVIRENEMWACTTCNACVEACPVLINQVDYIAEFRRTLVAENRLDQMKKTFLENVGRNSNPFGLPQGERQAWLADAGAPTLQENPGAEYIYWIGCQASYDPRAKNIARSVIKILRSAGVSFAVLGNEEACTGEPVRRMGEEARFQELALKNIETIQKGGLKTVVTHCPHCFNTFLNEYPEFGAKFKVVHHSQLLSELAAAGRIPRGAAGSGTRSSSSAKVTFHDPCNLGRINGEFDAPRNVLASQGVEVVEMKRNKMNSFCCGGGGANVWYQVPEKKKIGVIRVEEAKETGANVLAVACPFCISMFEDAAKTIGDDTFAIKDVAEILAEGLPDEKKLA